MSWFSAAHLPVPIALAVALTVGAACTAPSADAAAAPITTRLATAGTVIDTAGHMWSSDSPYALGGEVVRTQGAVSGVADRALFAASRTGVTGYRIPVAAQTNAVTVGLLERPQPHNARSFQVLAEGVVVGGGVVPAGSGNRASRVGFAVRVTDGYLDLAFSGPVAVATVTITSTGTPSPQPGAVSTSGTPYSPEAFGAKGDGVTDDTTALQRAFDSAPPGRPVVLTAGRTYVHTGVLHLRTRWLHVTGAGTLLATAEANSSVWIEADNVIVDGGVVIKTSGTTRRWDAWEQMGVRIVGHSGVILRSITVDGSAAAGIYVGNGASKFLLDHVTVQNTRADGIHMTGGANRGLVVAPVVRNSGDDGVAVVSYRQDGTPCHDISVVSPTVLGTTWGRGLSVVGGTRITETDIDVRDTSAAGLYVASEGNPWFTAAPQQVVVTGGTITGANTDTSVDHGAVLVLSGETGGIVPNDVTVQQLQVSGTRVSASRNLGVITYGDAPRNVLFSAIAITGGPAAAYQGNTPTGSYRLVEVTHDGVPVPVSG